MLKLKLQYFSHLIRRTDSLEKKGMTEDKMLDGIADSMDMSLSKLQEIVENRDAWRAAVHGVTELDMTWRLNNNNIYIYSRSCSSA